MKRQLLIPTVLLLSPFFIQSVRAQSNNQTIKSKKVIVWQPFDQSAKMIPLLTKNQQDSLRAINRTRFTIPNTLWLAENKKAPQVLVLADNQNMFLKNKRLSSLYRDVLKDKKSGLNAGSPDPGIFYAPNEHTKPAAMILKPLKDVDPLMSVNPDSLNRLR